MFRPLLLVAFCLAAAASTATGQSEPDAWMGEGYATGIEAPVDIVFGPDGTLYYAELESGMVRAIPPGATTPLPDAIAKVDSSRSENGGFLGLALDPEFELTGAFFVYYSFEKPSATNGFVNRVSRLDAAGEHVLVDDIPWFERHDGGRLVFTGPDTLVVTTGDNELREPAQDPESLLGKTLRMTREGKPAPDNPDPTSLIYTLGHRNAFGLAYDAESETLWSTENGPQTRDEINIIVAGGNYGWPKHLGISYSRSYVDPIVVYEDTIGPTGGTVFESDFYFGAVNDASVRSVTREANGSYADAVVWKGPEPVLDVEAGPDGRLYVGGFSTIYVLTPPGYVAPATPITPTPGGSGTGTTPASPTVESATPEDPAGAARIPGAGVALVVGALVLALAVGRRG